MKIDPADSTHLYLTSGVQGPQHGFYVSHDRGETWRKPQGFIDFVKAGGSDDVTVMDVDPADFAHILISSHSPWTTATPDYHSGIVESRDGGETWVTHIPPGNPWAAGTKMVMFLHHPASGQGNGDTWLVSDENAGFWRTEDAGKNWTQVSNHQGVHGGPAKYFTAAGVLFVGALGNPLRSKDNGKTFEEIPALAYKYWFALTGDGNRLYARSWNDTGHYMVSPESDGMNWTPLDVGQDPLSSIRSRQSSSLFEQSRTGQRARRRAAFGRCGCRRFERWLRDARRGIDDLNGRARLSRPFPPRGGGKEFAG